MNGQNYIPQRQERLLQVEGLTVDFDPGKPTQYRALDHTDLEVRSGETVGLVGESGSGKTVLAHSILRLLPATGKITHGRIEWRGRNLVTLPESEVRHIRGKEIAMIFQDPQASLNPVYRVGRQIEWVLKLHRGLSGSDAKAEVMRLFSAVQLPNEERCYESFPHQLSGGMCQRVLIAMALGCRPRLLIADEPTSALDVTIQAELVALLKGLRDEFNMAMLFVTHDLGVASNICQRVVVLQHGKVVEQGSVREVFESPKENYTRRLIASIFTPIRPTEQQTMGLAGMGTASA